jgi:uncharacterized protein
MAISLTNSSAYTQDFDSLANSGTSNTLPGDWLIAESGANANATYTAGSGSGIGGDTYSFGATGSTDRALGGLRSGSLIPSFGTSFTNNTGSSISTFNISYIGEQWRLGAAGRADRLDFQYSTDATSLTTGTWIDVDTLDFTTPTTTGTVGLRDGNIAANRTALSGNITGLSINNGSNFWIRWTDLDVTGSDDGLAIDDFSISPTVAVASPGITITQSDGNTGVTEGGASDSYQVSLNIQPTADVTITLTNPGSPSQLAVTPTTLTFTPTNWNTAQLISVTAVDDSLVEGLQNSVINHSIASADANYNTISVSSVTVGIVDNDVTVTKIHDIQGSGSTFNSAFGGSQTIEGVVVGDFKGTTKLNGFYVQEEDADADTDAATSEGIFVFDPNGLFTGAVGSKVRLTGNVGEFTSSSTSIAGTANSSLTQISGITNIVNLGNIALPTVTNIVLPLTSTADLERYEGTLVNISAGANPLTVTETFKLGRFGQVGLSGNGRINQYTQSNAPSASGYTDYLANLQDNYIILDDGSTVQNPDPNIHARGGQPLSASNTLRGGDSIASISGVLDERFEGFRVQTTTPANFLATNAREATAPAVGGNLKVASFNLLNFFNGNGIDADSDGSIDGGFPTPRGANNAAEFKRQLDKTVQAVLGLNPDIFGYNEIENDGYGANSAVQELVDALNAVAGAGTYAFVNPPATALDASGRFGGDEITVGFIYKTSAARVAPGTNPAALTTGAFDQVTARVQRPALAVTFERLANGAPTNETFTAVTNHFKSKGSSAGGAGDADAGDGQGLSNGTRTRAAQELAAWLATNPTGTSDTDYLITGDLNAYQLEDPVTTLTSAGYNNLFNSDSYSFQFNGQWGSLDHALASGSLNGQVTGAAKWHINSDEPTVLDYNTEFKTAGQVSSFYNVDPFRSSDHDPIVVELSLQANATPQADSITGGSGNDSISGLAGDDTINGGAGNDTIDGGNDADYLNGNAGNDSLIGGAGDDILDGAGDNIGMDTFAGGAGDENYGVYNSDTSISELDAEGNDTVWTAVDYTLSDFVENLYLVGQLTGNGNSDDNVIVGYDVGIYATDSHTINGLGGDDSLYGGAATDTINGGDGADYLNGRLGNDSLIGGAGNDILDGAVDSTGMDTFAGGTGNDVYGVYNSDTIITELDDEGSDTVWTAVDYTLSDFVENLYLVGQLTGNGNSGNNVIVGYGADNHVINGLGSDDYLVGGAGNDTIDGGEGADYLSGGAGNDTFAFRFGQSSYMTADRVLDFTIDTDKVALFSPAGMAAPVPSSFSRANDDNTSNSLLALVNAVYIDADGAMAGNQALGAGAAAIVVSTGSSTSGTYLVIDDGTAGLTTNDVVVNISGVSGNFPTFGSIPVNSFFAENSFSAG